jgi:hypothetical protein
VLGRRRALPALWIRPGVLRPVICVGGDMEHHLHDVPPVNLDGAPPRQGVCCCELMFVLTATGTESASSVILSIPRGSLGDSKFVAGPARGAESAPPVAG